MSYSSSSPIATAPLSSSFTAPTPDNPLNTPFWGKGLGGSGSDTGNAIAVDSSGNTYVTGKFNGSNVPFGATALTSADVLTGDVFVAKLSKDGTVLWSKNFGGANLDVGQGISVDSTGNVYVTGYFQDNRPLGSTTPNPNVLFGSTTFQNQGVTDIFALKLNSNDGSVAWAKSFGGSGIDIGYGISVDASDNAYITGTFASPSITFGATTLTSKGSNDIFAVQLDKVGNVAWARGFGGNSTDTGFGISVDRNGGVVLTGDFQETVDFGGGTVLTSKGGSDLFALKLNTKDGGTTWAKSFGGTGFDGGQAIGTDKNGNAYITGSFINASVSFGTTLLTSQGVDVLALKLNSTDGSVAWAKNFGGINTDFGYGISVDGSGNAYIAGAFNSTKATFGTTTLTKDGDPVFTDGFSAKLNGADGSTAWARSFGGASSDFAYGIAVDSLGYSYVTGEFVSNPLVAGSVSLANQGNSDAFVLNFAPVKTNLSSNTPDFNGDGYADLVWRNSATGENVIWYLKGTAFAGSDGSAGYVPKRGVDYDSLLTIPDPDWAIVGYGDFNGDKQTDLVWRNARTGQNDIWYLKGKDFAGGDASLIRGRDYDSILTIDDRNWTIDGVGDFNGDQKPDLVWRNLATGQNVIWFMDGKNFLGGSSTALGLVEGRDYRNLLPVPDRSWKIEAVADMNGDGRSDLIWRNYATGDNVIWYIKDTNLTPKSTPAVAGVDYEFFLTLNDRTWQIEAATDLNNDGKNDIIWRNYATGKNAVWYFDGAKFKSNPASPKEGQDFDYFTTVTDPNWRIGDLDRF